MITEEKGKYHKILKKSEIWNFLIYGSTIAIGFFLYSYIPLIYL